MTPEEFNDFLVSVRQTCLRHLRQQFSIDELMDFMIECDQQVSVRNGDMLITIQISQESCNEIIDTINIDEFQTT